MGLKKGDSAIHKLDADGQTIPRLNALSMPLMEVEVEVRIFEILPNLFADCDSVAYSIVPRAMNTVFGEGGRNTDCRPNRSGNGTTTWIVTANIFAEVRSLNA